ncbi:MAG TPA: MBOAT family protein, partial [Chromatiaceae bacterium]|nr:MBOAT family protein [Chromatiaceae bacterium]
DIVLPLAISFFTFQQIAYLVDAYKGITHEYRFMHYALFVTFFPQLIAGPIVHHKEMLPQFMTRDNVSPRLENITIGLTIFFIGLFKKSVLADGVAPYSTSVFEAAATGHPVTFFVAWGGALAYTMQLYFDFSGYSDMAIGAARLFGIRLPLNFHSPHKAVNIVEFWRRWHITLSRFLRDYLYIPLGGNRKGKFRRYLNLFLTMLLGGLWHGAGWTFVVWGGLHGLYLAINHAWGKLRPSLPFWFRPGKSVGKALAWSITFLAVVVGWVFFRAPDFPSAINMLQGMAMLNGVALPNGIMVRLGGLGEQLQALGVGTYLGRGTEFLFTWLWLLPLMLLSLFFPNTQQIMARFEPALATYEDDKKNEISTPKWLTTALQWHPSLRWSWAMGGMTLLGILALSGVSEFLYFQF